VYKGQIYGKVKRKRYDWVGDEPFRQSHNYMRLDSQNIPPFHLVIRSYLSISNRKDHVVLV
jgi:hypothetical protein